MPSMKRRPANANEKPTHDRRTRIDDKLRRLPAGTTKLSLCQAWPRSPQVATRKEKVVQMRGLSAGRSAARARTSSVTASVRISACAPRREPVIRRLDQIEGELEPATRLRQQRERRKSSKRRDSKQHHPDVNAGDARPQLGRRVWPWSSDLKPLPRRARATTSCGCEARPADIAQARQRRRGGAPDCGGARKKLESWQRGYKKPKEWAKNGSAARVPPSSAALPADNLAQDPSSSPRHLHP